jgi:hypothetical protein
MEGLAGHKPMSIWIYMTQKNIDTWRQMMGLGSEKDDSKSK